MTDVCEGVSVGVIPEPEDKYLNVRVVEIDFHESYKTANNKATVNAPHWPCNKYQFNYSEKPAVYRIATPARAKVKIEVDCKGMSGSGKLIGNLQGFRFEGKMNLSNGQQVVDVTMDDSPDSVRWLKGQASWGAEGCGLSVSAGNTFVELFFVIDDPAKPKFFSGRGVWAEALRFLFENGRVSGVKDAKAGAAEVTKCCFGFPYHKYEIDRGAAKFGGATRKFSLTRYMDEVDGRVNCYDQTYAVIVFSGALGVSVDGLFLDPFGFLNYTDIVGWGPCNNPFPNEKYMAELRSMSGSTSGRIPKPEDYLSVSPTDPKRNPFSNHMFCELSAKIYDACAGPETGSRSRAGYATANIDATPGLYPHPGARRAGEARDMQDYKAILVSGGVASAEVLQVD